MNALQDTSLAWKGISKQFGLFALVGLAGTAGHYAVLFGLVEQVGVGAVAASGWGALTGLLINYLLNYGLTFNSGQPHWRAFPKFAFIAGLGLGLNLLLMALLIQRLGLYYLLAQVLATGVVLLWNFIGNRWWTFHEDNGAALATAFAGCCQLSAILALVLLIRLLSLGVYPLVDPSESRYAEMARKMLETGNWVTPQIDYGVWFWGKPPLAVWLNATSLAVFGVNEFAARLSALLLSAGSVWLVHHLAASRESTGQRFAAPAMLAGMVLFFVMSGSVAMDQCLALGVTLSMAAFWLALHGDKPAYGWLFFIGLAIGLMSKGPIALILCGLPIGLWVLSRNAWGQVWQSLPWIRGTLLMLALSVPWYLLAEARTPGFLEYFLVGEHWKRFTEPGWQGDLYGSGHAHARGIVWLYWLLAAAPWSLLFVAVVGVAVWRRQARELLASADGWRGYCVLWMLSPLLFFSVSANAIWTYVLPGLPGCALLLAEWRRDGRLGWFGCGKPAAVLGLLVPVGFLCLVVVWQFHPLKFVRTQKDLVRQYYQARQNDSEKLRYLRENPFSAQFYTRGKSEELSNIEDFQNIVESPGRDYYVCPQRHWPDMPDAIRDRLEVVGIHNGFMLLRRNGQGAAK